MVEAAFISAQLLRQLRGSVVGSTMRRTAFASHQLADVSVSGAMGVWIQG